MDFLVWICTEDKEVFTLKVIGNLSIVTWESGDTIELVSLFNWTWHVLIVDFWHNSD